MWKQTRYLGLAPNSGFSPPNCPFLVKVVTKKMLVTSLRQTQEKWTALCDTETLLGQCSPLVKAVWQFTSVLLVIHFSVRIEPGYLRNICEHRLSLFLHLSEAPIQQSPSWWRYTGASSPPEPSHCLPSQCTGKDRHSMVECVWLWTGSPEPPCLVLNWPYWAPHAHTDALSHSFPSRLPSVPSTPPKSSWGITVSTRGCRCSSHAKKKISKPEKAEGFLLHDLCCCPLEKESPCPTR